MDEIVKVTNLSHKFYTKEDELEVLNDINFTLKQGEILTLLGPSGSGKSTILNILTKLVIPTSCEVILNGNVGYMFQKDNIAVGLEI